MPCRTVEEIKEIIDFFFIQQLLTAIYKVPISTAGDWSDSTRSLALPFLTPFPDSRKVSSGSFLFLSSADPGFGLLHEQSKHTSSVCGDHRKPVYLTPRRDGSRTWFNPQQCNCEVAIRPSTWS